MNLHFFILQKQELNCKLFKSQKHITVHDRTTLVRKYNGMLLVQGSFGHPHTSLRYTRIVYYAPPKGR